MFILLSVCFLFLLWRYRLVSQKLSQTEVALKKSKLRVLDYKQSLHEERLWSLGIGLNRKPDTSPISTDR
jgi:hypothetical protein